MMQKFQLTSKHTLNNVNTRPYSILIILLLGLITAVSCSQEEPPSQQIEEDLSTAAAIKIEVEQSGIHQINRELLQNNGFAVSSWDANHLQLSENGQSVPYWLDEDTLYFYGRASDSIYSEMRPYILESEVAGTLMQQAAAPESAEGGPQLTSIQRPLHLEENQVYASSTHTPEYADTWFWHTIHVEQQFTFEADLHNVADGSAILEMHLYGSSHDPNVENDHDFDLVINDQTIQTIQWEGQKHFVDQIALDSGTLKSGRNSFLLNNAVPGATFVDIMQLDWLSLVYRAEPTAVNDQIELLGELGQLALGGFSSAPLVLDIANPTQPQLLDWEFSNGRVSGHLTPDMHVMAAAQNGFLQPTSIRSLQDSDLRANNVQADLIIISTEEMLPALNPLIEAREAQGLSVVAASTAEIYDAFGFGNVSPISIKSFLSYAHENWESPKPAYLLIVGDATYDFRNYLGQRPRNHVPSIMVPVTHSGETVSDARLADLNADMKPDLAVGRWPVSDVAAVESLVARTLAYESGQAVDQTIFSADGTSLEFTGLSDYLLEESNLPIANAQKLYGSTFTEVANSWNEGAWLVTYVGHGSLNLWGKDSLFTTEAVEQLEASGTPPPIVLQFTCLTGYFAHPTDTSISETLLTHENGPVLIVAATSLTLSSQQRPFAVSLLDALQNTEITRMGDILQYAKKDLDVTQVGLREISDTFGLLGDPSALVVRPQTLDQAN